LSLVAVGSDLGLLRTQSQALAQKYQPTGAAPLSPQY
jgi:hypothetical protein